VSSSISTAAAASKGSKIKMIRTGINTKRCAKAVGTNVKSVGR